MRATVTTGGPVSKRAEQEARCAGLRKLSYSAKGDTTITVRGIRAHNEVLKKKGCKK